MISQNSRRILMIAYHFPPLAGSSGVQRTLRFVQHLPRFGWQPLVLSAHPRAYERTSADLDAAVPAGTVVRRAFALDTARHLAIGGRYVRALARPDRWMTWKFDAVREGLRLVREYAPSVIWSTYPIATAHLVGYELQRRTGLPWVADFRDPMAQEGYPADPITHVQFTEIEATALRHAARSMFTTPGAAAEYRRRYPDVSDRVSVLENGYDEETFAGITLDAGRAEPLRPGAVTLLHSGIVYASERDPTQLMAALRRLHDKGVIRPGHLMLRFRASLAEGLLRRLAEEHGVTSYVELCGPLPYADALAEMLRADALLVLQASNCNEQIPAKVYEYLRAGRPMIGLTDPAGDTAGVMRAAGLDAIARLDDAADIAALLERFLGPAAAGLRTLPDAGYVRAASREGRAKLLSQVLGQLAEAR